MGERTRASQRPYFSPPRQAMPPVVPSVSPEMVTTPFATLMAAGERRPFPAWPGPSYTPQAARSPSKSSLRVAWPQPHRPAAVVVPSAAVPSVVGPVVGLVVVPPGSEPSSELSSEPSSEPLLDPPLDPPLDPSLESLSDLSLLDPLVPPSAGSDSELVVVVVAVVVAAVAVPCPAVPFDAPTTVPPTTVPPTTAPPSSAEPGRGMAARASAAASREASGMQSVSA